MSTEQKDEAIKQENKKEIVKAFSILVVKENARYYSDSAVDEIVDAYTEMQQAQNVIFDIEFTREALRKQQEAQNIINIELKPHREELRKQQESQNIIDIEYLNHASTLDELVTRHREALLKHQEAYKNYQRLLMNYLIQNFV